MNPYIEQYLLNADHCVIRNTCSGSLTIPAFGVVMVSDTQTISSTAEYPILDVVRCDEDGGGGKLCLINGPEDIVYGKWGRAFSAAWPIAALYDTSDGTPTAGEDWGPGKDSFKLRQDIDGFITRGTATHITGVILVHRVLIPADVKHWGTLAADLAYNNSTGVTVNLIQGGSKENVLPPPNMTSGTYSSGNVVMIERLKNSSGVRNWYVTHPSPIETLLVDQVVVTDWQVDAPDIEMKTRSLRVIPNADETGWVTEHNGTECP